MLEYFGEKLYKCIIEKNKNNNELCNNNYSSYLVSYALGNFMTVLCFRTRLNVLFVVLLFLDLANEYW